MNRREFAGGSAALAASLAAAPASAINLAGQQVTIEAKFLVVKEQGSRGFGIDLDRAFPSFNRQQGGNAGVTFGIGIGTGHNTDTDVGLGLTLGGGNRAPAQPSLQSLVNSAAPAGRIGLAGDRLVHAASAATYEGVNTIILVNGRQTFVIGGLIEERRAGRTNSIPSFGRIPVLGEAFRTPGEGNRRPEVIIVIRPGLVDQAR